MNQTTLLKISFKRHDIFLKRETHWLSAEDANKLIHYFETDKQKGKLKEEIRIERNHPVLSK